MAAPMMQSVLHEPLLEVGPPPLLVAALVGGEDVAEPEPPAAVHWSTARVVGACTTVPAATMDCAGTAVPDPKRARAPDGIALLRTAVLMPLTRACVVTVPTLTPSVPPVVAEKETAVAGHVARRRRLYSDTFS